MPWPTSVRPISTNSTSLHATSPQARNTALPSLPRAGSKAGFGDVAILGKLKELVVLPAPYVRIDATANPTIGKLHFPKSRVQVVFGSFEPLSSGSESNP